MDGWHSVRSMRMPTVTAICCTGHHAQASIPQLIDGVDALQLLTERHWIWEMKAFSYQGEVIQEPIAKMRAMTITGLTLFIDVTLETWRTYRLREDLSEVVTRAEQVIYDQKFSGAAADLLNANIIARDLGLKEQSQVEDVTPDKGDRDKRRSRIKELFNRGTGRDS